MIPLAEQKVSILRANLTKGSTPVEIGDDKTFTIPLAQRLKIGDKFTLQSDNTIKINDDVGYIELSGGICFQVRKAIDSFGMFVSLNDAELFRSRHSYSQTSFMEGIAMPKMTIPVKKGDIIKFMVESRTNEACDILLHTYNTSTFIEVKTL